MKRATLVLAGLVTFAAAAAGAQDVPRVVSGRIFDDTTGCPLKGVRVNASDGNTENMATAFALTDANGRYRMGKLPPGSMTLAAVLAGYQIEYVRNLVVSDSYVRVDFSLIRAAGDSAAKAGYPKKACRLEPRDSSL